MGAEVFNAELVLHLNGLELAVNHLKADDGAIAIQEAGAIIILYLHRIMAVLDVSLKALVNSDNAAFARLLFPQNQFISAENLAPCELAQIRYAETKETSASDEQGHAVFPVPIKLADQCHSRVPRKIICGCIGMLLTHNAVSESSPRARFDINKLKR